MARYGCDRCGESYDEDNLYECARCKRDVCWKCGVLAEIPEIAAGYAWCDPCLNEVGRADLLKGKRSKERCTYGIREKFLAIESLREAIMKSEPGMLPWPRTDAERKLLTSWLEAVELDVDEDSCHFVVPPSKMAADADELIFTEFGYMKLAIELTDKPLWLRHS
jgi:hypothetical protein